VSLKWQDEDFVAEKDDAGSPTDESSEDEGSNASEDEGGEVNNEMLWFSRKEFEISFV
jgi:hypothetical protein